VVQDSVIDKALKNAAHILANFKGEGERTKLEEWEACYAMLFKQMNDLVQSTKPVMSNIRSVGLTETKGECQEEAKEFGVRVPGAAPTSEQPNKALSYLGGVLYMLADLHPDDHCQAYTDAVTYYNASCPDKQVLLTKKYETRLIISKSPLDIPTKEQSVERDKAFYEWWRNTKSDDVSAPTAWKAASDSVIESIWQEVKRRIPANEKWIKVSDVAEILQNHTTSIEDGEPK